MALVAVEVKGDVEAEYEALLQFLYLAPVGLAQTTLDGEIVMINPISAQLLMPLCTHGFTNLFTALEGIAPDLRHQASTFGAASGLICDGIRISLAPATPARPDPQTLSCTLLKLDVHRLMVVLSDVTQQVKRERLLRQSEAWINAIMTGVKDYALISLDAEGRVDSWNESIGRITGYDRSAVGQPYSIFYPNDGMTADRVLDRLREADESGWSIDDGWRQRADGTRFWGSGLISPLRLLHDDAGPAYCLIIRDISDKLDATEKIRQASSCDHLTGIANRRTFFEAAQIELARWIRAPRPLSLLMLDADHFKTINDRFGHPAGDAVLRNLAAVLTKTFRECDIVARIGGEEFAVLLPSTTTEGALAVANRMLKVVADQTLEIEGQKIQYTVSGGVAAMAPDVAGIEALFKRADQALYAAKGAGRNRVQSYG
jgi:diguanylate cyclase (GGDEF)-like protein/PAS domain S-box-containing protein